MSEPIFDNYLDLSLSAEQNSEISFPTTPLGQRANEVRTGGTPSPAKEAFQRACHRNFRALLERMAVREYDGNVRNIPPEVVQQFKVKAEEVTRQIWTTERQKRAAQSQQSPYQRTSKVRTQTPRSTAQNASSQNVAGQILTPVRNYRTPSHSINQWPISAQMLQTPGKQMIPIGSAMTNDHQQYPVTPIGFQTPAPFRFMQTCITPTSLDRTEEEELEHRSSRLRDSILNLNEMLRMRNTDHTSRANYPYRQQDIIQRMHTILLFRSGLLPLASALQARDSASYYHLTQTANTKLQELLPQIQDAVRTPFNLIRDPTTRVSATSKTFTTFYDGFCGIKGRLCAEDRKRRNSQEKLADTMQVTRLQVWHCLEPPAEDEELEEVLIEDGIEDPYGSAYALQPDNLGDGSNA